MIARRVLIFALCAGCATTSPMGMVDARGACHGSDGRYATASTCRGGLSEEGVIALGVLGGAALVGLVVWLAARPSRPQPPGAASAAPSGSSEGPIPPDQRARNAHDEAIDEARAMGRNPARRCVDNNGTVHVVRGLCSEHRMRSSER